MDFTTYPEGFEALLAQLNVPGETEEERREFLLQLFRQLMDV